MEPDKKKSLHRLRATMLATIVVVFAVSVLSVLLLRDKLLGASLVRARDVQPHHALQVTSTSFSAGSTIPIQYTCNGASTSPNIAWSGAPFGTRSYVVLMHDPDASIDFTQWLVYNIPSDVHELAAGAAAGAMPRGSLQGMNSYQRVGYGPPCPPPGKLHHYITLVYALDTTLALPAGATRAQVEIAMRRHILAQGRLVGLFQHGDQ